jgi:hypothetical protein
MKVAGLAALMKALRNSRMPSPRLRAICGSPSAANSSPIASTMISSSHGPMVSTLGLLGRDPAPMPATGAHDNPKPSLPLGARQGGGCLESVGKP